jgi:hypothetical protein
MQTRAHCTVLLDTKRPSTNNQQQFNGQQQSGSVHSAKLHWQQMSWGNFGRICNPSVLQARQHAETKEATKIAIFTAMYCFDKHSQR